MLFRESASLRPLIRLYWFFFNLTLLTTPAYYFWREELFLPLLISLSVLISLKVAIHIKTTQ